jgi:sugar/nucleoside kinase (ribokinase family)
MIALLGNLTHDLVAGAPARPGGAPFHAARALPYLETPALVLARCAEGDRDELLEPLVALGADVRYVPGTATASFGLSYDGDRRQMTVLALGDVWLPADLPALPDDTSWVHVGPLVRSDFPAATLAALAQSRRLSFDGQGLVRPARTGALELDADFDAELLRHISVLKLSEEEAAVLGDPCSLGVPEVLVTEGSLGSTVYFEGRAERIPATRVDAEPTGAGDAFCLGYVAARSEGCEPVEAARRATTVVGAMLRR